MSIFDFFRTQNAFDPNQASGGMSGGQPSWQDAIMGGLRSVYGDQSQQQGVQKPVNPVQAPAPPTRAALPEQTTNASSLDDIVNRPVNPYNPYGGLYNLNPGIDYTNQPHPELDKYSQMLDQYPERPTPSWMRMLGTGAYSYAKAQQDAQDQVEDVIGPTGRVTRTIKHGVFKPLDYEEAKKILQDPYETQLGDYGNELKARAAGAQLERQTLNDQSLANQRQATATKSYASIPRDDAKAAATIQRQNDQSRIGAMSAETRRRAEMIAEATKDMTDSEKEQYRAQTRLTVEDMQNAGALQREREAQAAATQRNTATIAGANTRAEGVQAGENQRAANKQLIGQLPTQQIAARKLLVNKAIQAHPDWSSYFENDDNGIPQIKSPSSWRYGYPSQATYDEIVQYMDAQEAAARAGLRGQGQQPSPNGPAVDTTSTTQTPPTTSSTTQTQPGQSTNRQPAAPKAPNKTPANNSNPNATTANPSGVRIEVRDKKTGKKFSIPIEQKDYPEIKQNYDIGGVVKQ